MSREPEYITKTATALYDVAEHLRTPEDMAAYLEASIEEAAGDAAFVVKALGDIVRARHVRGMTPSVRHPSLYQGQDVGHT